MNTFALFFQHSHALCSHRCPTLQVLLRSKLPPVVIPPADCRRPIFDIVTSFRFEVAISFLIILNTCFLLLEHYDQPDYWRDMLVVVNYIFVGIFTLEAVLKIFVLGPRQYWQVCERSRKAFRNHNPFCQGQRLEKRRSDGSPCLDQAVLR